jgi:flagellar basal body rod protein FlgG
MQVALDAATSGIKTVIAREEVSANNVANISTRGFSQTDALQTNMSPAGVKISSLRTTPNSESLDSNTDLTKEMVNQVINKNELAANVKVIQTQDKMMGALLDIIA